MPKIPAHFTPDGQWCPTSECDSSSGHCPLGCDHADHYANDGHPECDHTSGEPATSTSHRQGVAR